MSSVSIFESRKGNLEGRQDEVFDFITDIRNFRKFVREGEVSGLVLEKESASFNISSLGNVTLRISEKEAPSRVVYSGNAFMVNDFSMTFLLGEGISGKAEVTLTLKADMNPLLKMMAAAPVYRFLETLVSEMERISDWKP